MADYSSGNRTRHIYFGSDYSGSWQRYKMDETMFSNASLLADFQEYGGPEVGPATIGIFTALFYAAELALSPPFGLLSDRVGHHKVMQIGPVFGLIAVVITAFTAEIQLGAVVIAIPILVGSLPLLGLTRLLEGASTAACPCA